jgi:Uma2 family endonuclease
MSSQTIPYIEEPLPPKELLPTMYDLPDEEIGQSGMPDIFHVWQGRLLDETFRPPNYAPEEVFTAVDLNVYYNVHDYSQCKRPDWFAVVGLPKDKKSEMRMSYVIWQEEIAPLIVVELLSPSTMKDDLGKRLRSVSEPPTKWEVYERWLRVPYYVTFSKHTEELRMFRLTRKGYQEVKDHGGQLWIEEIELGIGLWQGEYLRPDWLWLRWFDRAGHWIPTPAEQLEQQQRRTAQYQLRAKQERQRIKQEVSRAEQERQEKEEALQKVQQLAAKLRELGIDPDQL